MIHMIIGRGKNGWHSSGTDHGHKWSSSGGSLDHYVSEAPDGTPVYDAEGADYNEFASFVIGGPMVDPTLSPGVVSRFGEKRTLLGMLPCLEGEFRSLGILTMAGLSSLDMVAVDVYLAMLREQVKGVKFGIVYQGKVVWE